MHTDKHSYYPYDYREIEGVMVPFSSTDQCSFAYTDGDTFEAKIQETIASAGDRTLYSDEMRQSIWDWRSGCHFDFARANVLRPIESVLSGSILEIGCGCGAITRYLGESAQHVIGLEPSIARARTARLRTADLPNVQIVCDRTENLHLETKVDVVLMVGVLQYSRLYSGFPEDGEHRLLKAAADNLKDDGLLIFTIQNKFGAKYLAGFPEPNTGQPYYGVEDRYGTGTIIRFSVNEIRNLLMQHGFDHLRIYSVFPDYHKAVAILSEEGVTHNTFRAGEFVARTPILDISRPDWRQPEYSLEKSLVSLGKAHLLGQMANALLVVASRQESAITPLKNRSLAWNIATRSPRFSVLSTVLDIAGDIVVERRDLTALGKPESQLVQNIKNERYLPGRLLWLDLVDIVNSANWTVQQIADWAKPWVEYITRVSGSGDESEINITVCVDGALIDAVPTNFIRDLSGKLSSFDNEWNIRAPITLGYVLYRGIFGSLFNISSCIAPAVGVPLQLHLLTQAVLAELSCFVDKQAIKSYIRQESIFQHLAQEKDRIELSENDYEAQMKLQLNIRSNREILEQQNSTLRTYIETSEKVSVIIPTYNRAPLIGDSIKSVLNQTYTNLEIIVVDDGSKDNTKEVVSEFSDSRLRYIWQPNRGRSNARNHALSLATGKYIAFLDSDDLYLPDKIERQVSYLREHPGVGMVYTSAYCVDQNGEMLEHKYLASVSGFIYESIAFFTPVTITLPTVMTYRFIMNQVGGFDEKMHRFEDTDMWRRISKAYRIDAMPDFTCYLRTHDDNHLTNQNGHKIADAIDYYTKKILDEDGFTSLEVRRRGVAGLYRYYGYALCSVSKFQDIGMKLLKTATEYDGLVHDRTLLTHITRKLFRILRLDKLSRFASRSFHIIYSRLFNYSYLVYSGLRRRLGGKKY